MTIPAPFMSSVMEIREDWIDFNGHLNMAYYNVLFDQCADEAYDLLGFGPDYLKNSGFTTFTGEFHLCYLRELKLGDQVRVSLQLVDHDQSKFHTYQEIHHVDGWLAATGEALGLHIDRSGPRVAPFPEDIAARVAAMKAAHDPLGWPERAGRKVGIRRKA